MQAFAVLVSGCLLTGMCYGSDMQVKGGLLAQEKAKTVIETRFAKGMTEDFPALVSKTIDVVVAKTKGEASAAGQSDDTDKKNKDGLAVDDLQSSSSQKKEELVDSQKSKEADHESKKSDDQGDYDDAIELDVEDLGYKNLGLANVRTSLNVRDGASITSNVIGSMQPDSACEIKKAQGNWTKITSGKVRGYVYSSYLRTGDEATDRARLLINDAVTVNADVLRVRQEANTSSAVITRVGTGTKLLLAEAVPIGHAVDQDVGDSKNKQMLDSQKSVLRTASKENCRKAVCESDKNPESVKGPPLMDKKVGEEAIYPKLNVKNDLLHTDNATSNTSKEDRKQKDASENFGENGWVEVEVPGDIYGYVSTAYVSRVTELSTAEPVFSAIDIHVETAPIEPQESPLMADVIVSEEISMQEVDADPEPISEQTDNTVEISEENENSDSEGQVDVTETPSEGDVQSQNDIDSTNKETEKEVKEDTADSENNASIAGSDESTQKQDEKDNKETEKEVKEDTADSEKNASIAGSDEGTQKQSEKEKKTTKTETDGDMTGATDNKDESGDGTQSSLADIQKDEENVESQPAEEESAPMEQTAAQPMDANGSDPATYAMQFIGGPYVWGGSSLTNGADCSGFVMSVYKQYGVNLPHSSAAQSHYGERISSSEAIPGDLFFYSCKGKINHVGIYIGNDKIVHASNSRGGIKVSNAYYQSPACVTRVVK